MGKIKTCTMSDKEFQAIDQFVVGAAYAYNCRMKKGVGYMDNPSTTYHPMYEFSSGVLSIVDGNHNGNFLPPDKSARILNRLTKEKRQAYLKILSKRQVAEIKQRKEKSIANLKAEMESIIESWNKQIDNYSFKE